MRQVATTAVLLGSLLVGTAQAQPFPFQDHDYDFQAMCTFVELVKGFTLPSLRNGFDTDPHFHFLRSVDDVVNDQGERETWRLYHYANGGVSAEVTQAGAGAYFTKFRINDDSLPVFWRDKATAMATLGVTAEKAKGNDLTFACWAYTIGFHFNETTLNFVEINVMNTD